MLTVYVALKEEGATVWRPVPARRIKDSVYQLLGIVPNQEDWQFTPGQVVECEERAFVEGRIALVACRLADE
jgi:hypothetical protein